MNLADPPKLSALFGDLDPPTQQLIASRLSGFQLVPKSDLQQLKDDQEAISQLKRSLSQQVYKDEEERHALQTQVASLKQQIIAQTEAERLRANELQDARDQLEKKRECLKVRESELRHRERELMNVVQTTVGRNGQSETVSSADETVERLSSRIRQLEEQLQENSTLKRLAERESRMEVAQRVLHERTARLREALAEKESELESLKARVSLTATPSAETVESVCEHAPASARGEFQRLVRSFILAIRHNDAAMKQALLPALCALSEMPPEDTIAVLKGITPLPRI